MKGARLSAVMACLVATIIMSRQAQPIAACQNQSCDWNSSLECFECIASPGFLCQVHNPCTACTERLCEILAPNQMDSAEAALCAALEPPAAANTLASFVTANAGVPSNLRRGGGFRVSIIRQTSVPALLLEAEFGPEGSLNSAVVHVFERPAGVASLRLGRLVMFSNDSRLVLGATHKMTQAEGQASFALPGDDALAAPIANKDAIWVGYFVAEVTWTDGGIWQVNRDDLLNAAVTQSGLKAD